MNGQWSETVAFVFRGHHFLESANEPSHGHFFRVEICTQKPCTKTKEDLQRYWTSELQPVLDGHDLNRVVYPATGENITHWIGQKLKQSPWAETLVSVALQETSKNRFELTFRS